MDWFRWHHGTVNDPKWRVVARRASARVPDVLSVFAAFLERASQSEPRGSIEGWDADDIAAGLDMEPDEVVAIHRAMQGKVLDGNTLSGWDKRQPKREREDSTATDRKRAQREREKSAESSDCAEGDSAVTGCDNGSHATSRHVTPRHAQIEEIEESREDKGSEANASGADAPADLKSVIFDQGLTWLAKQSGKPKDKLRSALGRACRDHGEARVIEVLGAAQREGPIDPLAWMERAFKARASPKSPPSKTRQSVVVGSPEWKDLEAQGLV